MSKSRTKNIVRLAVSHNETVNGFQPIPLPISFEDLINSADVVFEDNYQPLEINSCTDDKSMECLLEEQVISTSEILNPDNSLVLENIVVATVGIVDNFNDLEMNGNQNIENNNITQNVYSSDVEESNMVSDEPVHCVEIDTTLGPNKKKNKT